MQLKGRLGVLEIARRVRAADRTRAVGRGPQHGYRSLSAVSPNRKAGDRRLVDMSATTGPEQPWAPNLPVVDLESYTFLIGVHTRCTQSLGHDELGRLAEWAVIQSRFINGQWQRVAVYDTCHRKGVHVHLYDQREIEFTETRLDLVISSYKDVEGVLDHIIDRLTTCWWQENERRSDRGR